LLNPHSMYLSILNTFRVIWCLSVKIAIFTTFFVSLLGTPCDNHVKCYIDEKVNWERTTQSDRAYVYTLRDALCKRQLRVLVAVRKAVASIIQFQEISPYSEWVYAMLLRQSIQTDTAAAVSWTGLFFIRRLSWLQLVVCLIAGCDDCSVMLNECIRF